MDGELAGMDVCEHGFPPGGGHADRDHGPGLRRAAAGRGVRRGRRRGRRRRRRRRARSRRCAGAGRYIEDIPSTSAWRRSPTASRPRRGPPRWRGATRCIVCVPTPLTPNREPDLGAAARRARRRSPTVLQPGQLVVLESTTYPGTTRERLRADARGVRPARRARLPPGLLARARRPGPHGLHAAQRRRRSSAASPTACGDRAEALYGRVCDASSGSPTPEVAEMAKLLENIFRSVNIALVNEMADARRPDGHRHLGGRRRRLDQAVRLHALRAGPGHGRPLPAGRPVLPRPGRRASTTSRPSSSSSPARSTSRCRTSAVEKVERALNDAGQGRCAGARIARPRRGLQGRRRRHPRVAGAEDHRRAWRSSAPTSPTTTRTCPTLPELGLRERVARRGRLDGVRRGGHRHRPPGRRPPRDRRRACRSSTCAGSPARVAPSCARPACAVLAEVPPVAPIAEAA